MPKPPNPDKVQVPCHAEPEHALPADETTARSPRALGRVSLVTTVEGGESMTVSLRNSPSRAQTACLRRTSRSAAAVVVELRLEHNRKVVFLTQARTELLRSAVSSSSVHFLRRPGRPCGRSPRLTSALPEASVPRSQAVHAADPSVTVLGIPADRLQHALLPDTFGFQPVSAVSFSWPTRSAVTSLAPGRWRVGRDDLAIVGPEALRLADAHDQSTQSRIEMFSPCP